MKQLVIVHEGTQTVISLSDRVFLVDVGALAERHPEWTTDEVEKFVTDAPEMCGYRLDNYNMTNLFFGD
jgi:hypothetical protein